MSIGRILENDPVEASAPCRVDMGGTLDISTFFLPLRHLAPCTFNAALNMRTRVRLTPFDRGKIKISSRGFDDLVVDSGRAPFDHPMGLMLAVAAYYQAEGIWIEIDSSSPPRSALGGSSVAAVALIWAFSKALAKAGSPMPRRADTALLAHAIEQSVAGVPCGMQDQLAAAFGGVNGWNWQSDPGAPLFKRQTIIADHQCRDFSENILVAYCGEPHYSGNINGKWVRDFISGQTRDTWEKIAGCSRHFIDALETGHIARAREEMNLDVDLRCRMTPDVLDSIGRRLVDAARQHQCGARFTGAGGGGCVWALGEPDQITRLKPVWQDIMSGHPAAAILKSDIDADGVL
jgi:D-glycero-alpha-D-manno-heptose-7-phosphate kinase